MYIDVCTYIYIYIYIHGVVAPVVMPQFHLVGMTTLWWVYGAGHLMFHHLPFKSFVSVKKRLTRAHIRNTVRVAVYLAYPFIWHPAVSRSAYYSRVE